MNFRSMTVLLTLAPALLACSASRVDLDDSLVDLDDLLIEASSEPDVLAVVHERVQSMAVDEQRLYWFGSRLPRRPLEPGHFLRSCEKRNCAATLVTYDAPPHRVYDDFYVSGGNVHWYRWNASGELLACPIAGCSGSPRTLAKGLSFGATAFDDDRFYFSNALSLYSLSLSQPGPPQPIASLNATMLLIHEAYAYGLVGDSPLDEQPPDASLVRARKDSASNVETIADDVMFSPSRNFGFTVDTSSIYWTNNQLTGSINRCPLTGCSGGSDVVIGSLRGPQNLQIDGSELYYLYEPEPYRYALSSCTLPACAPSFPLIEHLDATDAFAMDGEYLYVATTEQDVSPSNWTVNTVSTIRRLPKPHRELP
jgi:hypothetical protein